MKDTAKIALVIPYFGDFNNYFPLFLLSCKNNPTIDWLIYTDCETEYDYPENAKIFKMTFSQFSSLTQRNFAFEIALNKPYKLCDFRPAYGEILQEDLQNYEFWGHCDCDLIFGDIRKFVTDEVLARYSKIFTRGHLTLYRNIPEVNAFYRTQTLVDFHHILTSPESYAFDEWGGVSKCWLEAGKPYFDELCFDDIRVDIEGFSITKQIQAEDFGPYNGGQADLSPRYRKMRHIAYAYQNGTLERWWVEGKTACMEEVLYVHLQKRKMKMEEGLLQRLQAENADFLIVPNQFLLPQERTLTMLRKLSPDTLTFQTIKAYGKSYIRNHLLRKIKLVYKQG